MSAPPPLLSGNENGESIVSCTESSSSSSQATRPPTVPASPLGSSRSTSISSQATTNSSQFTSISSLASTSTMDQNAEPSVEPEVKPSTSAANSITSANPSSIDTSNNESDEDKKKKMSDALDQAGTSRRAKRTRTVLNTAKGAEQINAELNEIHIIYNTGDSIGKRMTRAEKAKSDPVKHGAEITSANSCQNYTMPGPNGNGTWAGNMQSNVNRESTKGASKRNGNEKPVNGEATDEQLLPEAKRRKTKAQSGQPVGSKMVVPCSDAEYLWLSFQSYEVRRQASEKDREGRGSKIKNDKYVTKERLGKKISVPVGSWFESQLIKDTTKTPLTKKELGKRPRTFSFKVYFPPQFGRFFSQALPAVEYIHYTLETLSEENFKLKEKIEASIAEAKKKGENLWFGTMEEY